MLYEEGEKTVYAKAESTPRVDEKGNVDYRAPISVDTDQASPLYPFMGYAETFSSSKVVTAISGRKLDINETKRYTIVTWLEGFRSSNLEYAPEGATIKLGVEINAYEIK